MDPAQKRTYDEGLRNELGTNPNKGQAQPRASKSKYRASTPTEPRSQAPKPQTNREYQASSVYNKNSPYDLVIASRDDKKLYKKLVTALANFPREDRITELKKIHGYFTHFESKTKAQEKYIAVLCDIDNQLKKLVHYDNATIQKGRTHLFPSNVIPAEKQYMSFKAGGLSGDALKTEILAHFKLEIKNISRKDDLDKKISEFKGRTEYAKLQQGQGLMARLKVLFGEKNTASGAVKAVDKIVEEVISKLPNKM